MMVATADPIAPGHYRGLAETYLSWGWSVIPLKKGTKRAGEKWEAYQTARPPLSKARQWWPERSKRGIAVVCGKVSGGLLVRDWDDAESYFEWAEGNQAVAAAIPTVQTRRGFHCYLLASDGFTGSLAYDDGELRGDGNYVVGPGSHVWLDRDGTELGVTTVYNWIVPPTIDEHGRPALPRLDLVANGLIPEPEPAVYQASPLKRSAAAEPVSAKVKHSIPSKPSNPSKPKHTQSMREGCWCDGEHDADLDIAKLVNAHPITGPGQRNRALWSLAVDLRGRSDGTPPEATTEAVIEAWMDRYGHICTTQDRDHNFLEFEDMVDRVRSDGNFIARVEQALIECDMPEWASGLRQSIKRVLRVLIAADSVSAGAPFFMGCRHLAQLAGGMPVPTAYRSAQYLAKHGIVEVIQQGEPKPGGKATVYRFVTESQ